MFLQQTSRTRSSFKETRKQDTQENKDLSVLHFSWPSHPHRPDIYQVSFVITHWPVTMRHLKWHENQPDMFEHNQENDKLETCSWKQLPLCFTGHNLPPLTTCLSSMICCYPQAAGPKYFKINSVQNHYWYCYTNL